MLTKLIQIFASFFCTEDSFIIDASDSLSMPYIFPDNMKAEVLKMCVSLFLLLAVFLVAVFAYKKYIGSRSSHFHKSVTIKVLDRRSISQKTCIYLLRVVNKILVISETNNHVTLLAEFPPDTDIHQLCSEQTSPTYKQADLLEKVMNKLQKSSNPHQDL